MGRGKPSVMGARFGTFPTIPDLRAALDQGCCEAWCVARLGVIVKCQDYVHASRVQWLPRWVQVALGEPYDRVIQRRPQKIVDPKWREQRSAYRNHAEFLAFRKDGPVHRARSARTDAAAS
jgi:hypothetical protein